MAEYASPSSILSWSLHGQFTRGMGSGFRGSIIKENLELYRSSKKINGLELKAVILVLLFFHHTFNQITLAFVRHHHSNRISSNIGGTHSLEVFRLFVGYFAFVTRLELLCRSVTSHPRGMWYRILYQGTSHCFQNGKYSSDILSTT